MGGGLEQKRDQTRLCCLNIDMDPLDHYFAVRGYKPGTDTRLNAIYDDALPRFLDLFSKYGVKATFFVVGRDLENPGNRALLRKAVEAGHEIANHTQSHIQTYVGLSPEQKREEILGCHNRIADAVGSEPRGFRSPGWAADPETMSILEENGYLYDSSVFPSLLITPISYVNWLINRGRVTRFLNQPLVGLAPKKAYHPAPQSVWRRGGLRINELPLTILPVFQLPFMGTILFLWGRRVFKTSLGWMRLNRRPINYILHGIELVDFYREINDERLKAKPGVGLRLNEKIDLYEMMMSSFKSISTFGTLQEWALSLAGREEEVE